jgi:acyl-coenzyme A synthetase/AMP-(fatty) acid ligase
MLDGIELDAPALMLYTSGTTGNPKGVPLTTPTWGSTASTGCAATAR